MTTIITQTTGTTPEVHETAVAEAVATPKEGLRGLASRMRRAFGREKAAPAQPAASELAALAGGELHASRSSVQALARSLLTQDRTGEALEPEPELDEAQALAFLAAEAEEAESAEVEEPKTIPRAKSVPPPLPTASSVSSAPIEAVPVETAGTATEPAAPSRSAQLRARLAAAKAQRAQVQAMRADAPVSVEPAEVAASVQEEPPAEASAAAAESEQPSEASAEPVEAQEQAAEELEEFEDLEASALVEEPVSATR